MSELRSLIRELLLEELGKQKQTKSSIQTPSTAKRESVRIGNNQDLNAFALRLLELAKNPQAVGAIRNGQHQFELQTSFNEPAIQSTTPITQQPGPEEVVFASGLVTERQIAKLPDGLMKIRVAKFVRLTPLANDEARRRGIDIVRNNK